MFVCLGGDYMMSVILTNMYFSRIVQSNNIEYLDRYTSMIMYWISLMTKKLKLMQLILYNVFSRIAFCLYFVTE